MCGIAAWLASAAIALSGVQLQQHRAHFWPAWWLRQAACIRWHESRDQWRINTGNGYYGAYQFMLSTWYSVGGRVRPDLASPHEQTYRAHRVWARDGGSWREWGTAVVCGLR